MVSIELSFWFSEIYSWHENKYEDRIFKIKTCTLTPVAEKCSQLKDVVYDWNNKVPTYETDIAVATNANNLNSNTDIEFTITFKNEVAVKYGSSYSYQWTSGHEMTFR